VTTSTHRERPLPAVTCVGYFLVLLVITIVNVALPSIGDRIGAGIDGLQWAGVGSLALPAGPLLGGLLVQSVGWRAVFLLNVPVVVVTGIVAARVVRESREGSSPRLDRAGVLLGALFLAALTDAVIEAGHGGRGGSPRSPWSRARSGGTAG
jgi:DHA2 family methylenomycin A resistance protein-like MFS transporter